MTQSSSFTGFIHNEVQQDKRRPYVTNQGWKFSFLEGDSPSLLHVARISEYYHLLFSPAPNTYHMCLSVSQRALCCMSNQVANVWIMQKEGLSNFYKSFTHLQTKLKWICECLYKEKHFFIAILGIIAVLVIAVILQVLLECPISRIWMSYQLWCVYVLYMLYNHFLVALHRSALAVVWQWVRMSTGRAGEDGASHTICPGWAIKPAVIRPLAADWTVNEAGRRAGRHSGWLVADCSSSCFKCWP